MSSTTIARSEIAGAEVFSLPDLVNYQDGLPGHTVWNAKLAAFRRIGALGNVLS